MSDQRPAAIRNAANTIVYEFETHDSARRLVAGEVDVDLRERDVDDEHVEAGHEHAGDDDRLGLSICVPCSRSRLWSPYDWVA